MSRQAGTGGLFLTGIVALLLFLSLLPVIFSFKGLLVRGELLVFLIFLAISFVALLQYKQWGRVLAFITFALHLGNVVFIWFVTQKLFVVPLALSIVGFLISFPRWREQKKAKEEPAEASPAVTIAKEGATRREPYSRVLEQPAPRTTYTPGKLVASKFGTVYHAPKCEWANNIKKRSRMWFASEEEAEKGGYKPHSCLQ